MAVAVCVSFQPRKLRSRRFAIASNIIHIIVTIVTGVAAPGSVCWLFFRGRRARPLPVAGDQGQTMWTSTHGQWKKEVQEESEDVVFDAWRKHLQREGWCVGQWRRVKIYVTKLVKDHNNDAKR